MAGGGSAEERHLASAPPTIGRVAQFSEGAPGGAPEQLWINFGSTPDSMVIGWLTANMSAASVVEYGTASGVYTNSATGNATFYVYGPKYTSGLIHHVRLSGLSPNTQYFYRAGSAAVPGWSAEYSFMSNPGVGEGGGSGGGGFVAWCARTRCRRRCCCRQGPFTPTRWASSAISERMMTVRTRTSRQQTARPRPIPRRVGGVLRAMEGSRCGVWVLCQARSARVNFWGGRS